MIRLMMVSDEVSTSSHQWIIDSVYSHHVCYREELFDFLESSEDTVYLSDESSCAIKGIEIVSMKVHDGIVRILGEIYYISNFKKILISLSRLDSIGYR